MLCNQYISKTAEVFVTVQSVRPLREVAGWGIIRLAGSFYVQILCEIGHSEQGFGEDVGRKSCCRCGTHLSLR